MESAFGAGSRCYPSRTAEFQAFQLLKHLLIRNVQASEEELFSLFSPIGEILELYILRNSNGKSRGCAFVTYANKYLAQQAITQLNGKQVLTIHHLHAGSAWAKSLLCLCAQEGKCCLQSK